MPEDKHILNKSDDFTFIRYKYKYLSFLCITQKTLQSKATCIVTSNVESYQ